MDKQVVGFFDEEEKLLDAIKEIKKRALVINEIYMPYPVHEALEAVGKKSRLPTLAYFIGLTAVVAVLSFLYYTSVIDWPIVYGGKPFNSFPSFIVVTIILTILSITIGSLFFFSVRSKLWPGQKANQVDITINDNRFAVVIDINNNKTEVVQLFKDCGSIEVR